MCKSCYCNALDLGCVSVCYGELLISYFATGVNETIEFRVNSASGSTSQLAHLVLGQQLYFDLSGLNEYSEHTLTMYNNETGERMYFAIGEVVYDAFKITTGDHTALAATGVLTVSVDEPIC